MANKNIKELNTKYIKILTTQDQRKIIKQALNKIIKEEGVKEGRGLELICLSYLSDPYTTRSKKNTKYLIKHLLSLLDELYQEYKKRVDNKSWYDIIT